MSDYYLVETDVVVIYSKRTEDDILEKIHEISLYANKKFPIFVYFKNYATRILITNEDHKYWREYDCDNTSFEVVQFFKFNTEGKYFYCPDSKPKYPNKLKEKLSCYKNTHCFVVKKAEKWYEQVDLHILREPYSFQKIEEYDNRTTFLKNIELVKDVYIDLPEMSEL